ncbi:MAG: protoporphyrinogen oxidase [Armatimonadota bacterium]|nr:protoporphyrinogen oxidase [bacterium]MCS7309017.1 protoporphyrinogen oxidase [Armatimonadota bacterium]MDW8104519.1 protoporphyrinogen oxidase [Armatimonadota bacterium]MDW8289098.1 protoporphyrinogen oxidase [Armatimonadota bacterium]
MGVPHVVVVGGGITGLAAAYYLQRLQQQAGTPLRITLLEAQHRLGGKVETVQHEGFLLDTGPDSFLTLKPWALQLCRELGMEAQLLSPSARQFFLLIGGRLHAVPHELVSLVPTRPQALWRATFLSLLGKLRASMEGLVPAQRNQEDEALGAFLRRRFGKEFAMRFAEPLMAGIHAGHPDRLSMAAVYPMYWEMERRYGSITRGLIHLRRQRQKDGAPRDASPFMALRDGMGSLINRLQQRLRGVDVMLSTPVAGIDLLPDGSLHLRLEQGEPLHAHAVILTVPAYTAAKWLQPLSETAARLLHAIPYASTAVVSLAYRRQAVGHPLEGSGFLVPRTEPVGITGCTWSSSKWEGRAPADHVLLRVFIGYAGADQMVEQQWDELLARVAHDALCPLLDIREQPLFAQVHRWLKAMPQYEVGHLARLRQLEEALSAYPMLLLAGSAYRGVGIPDCIRQGKEAADRAWQYLLRQ